MNWEVRTSSEFDSWLSRESAKSVVQVLKRIAVITETGYLGDHKNLGQGLWELRWKNGRRVYFARIDQFRILLLLGGLKNAQNKQIKKARRMLD